MANNSVSPKRPKQRINGWINLHKPLGMSSAQAVGKLKWLLRPEKIGHAGTLDPLATGVLPIALGEGTKCVNFLMDAKKTYEFTITFGESRTTDDAEGEVLHTSDYRPTFSEIQAVLPQFTGRITQIPPIYSALKIGGERAYALARAGQMPEMAAREVTVESLVVSRESLAVASDNSRLTTLNFTATVSKGTYIRSLGRDIARAVGTQGYISRLHRAAVGPFSDSDAISLDFIEETVHKTPVEMGETPWIRPLHTALDDIPALALTEDQLRRLRHGQSVLLATPFPPAPLIVALFQGEVAALTRSDDGVTLTPTRLLNL